jgi:hypothetical protein
MTRCAEFMMIPFSWKSSNENFVSSLPRFSFCPLFSGGATGDFGAPFCNHSLSPGGTAFTPHSAAAASLPCSSGYRDG